MFAIFGVSRKLAAKEVDKKLRNVNSSFTREYKALSQDEQKDVYEIEIDRLFKSMKPKQVSGDVGTPDNAKSLLVEFKKNKTFSKLEIRARVPARDKNGEVKRSKTNNKISLTWVLISEYEKHLNLLKQLAA